MRDGSELCAAALVSYPDGRESPDELAAFRAETWDTLGSGARERYEAFGAAYAPLTVEAPHIHLNMIGVRRSAEGLGHGRRLMDFVHEMSREDPRSEGVTLTTSRWGRR